MNIPQLQEEYDRLCQRIKALNQQPASAIDPSEWRELVENLESLTSSYRLQLAEAQAHIAELTRELFGPKADRLTPEQQDQLNQLLQDMEADSQQPLPTATRCLRKRQLQSAPSENAGHAIRCLSRWRLKPSPSSRTLPLVPAAAKCRAALEKKFPRKSTSFQPG